MALIALRRYQAITKPFSYMPRTDRSQKCIFISILVIWTFSVGLSIWLYPFVTLDPFDDSYFARVAFIHSRIEVPFVETFGSLTLLVILPFVFGFSYSLAASCWIYKWNPPGHLELRAWQLNRTKKIKSILMIMAVVTVFATFSSPIPSSYYTSLRVWGTKIFRFVITTTICTVHF